MDDDAAFGVIVPVLAALLCAAAHGQTFTNPVVTRGADPWAFQWGGQYFYTSTTGSDVKVARSPWLQSLNSTAPLSPSLRRRQCC